jgi:endonuclease/exonuclease/phosphatase (EEP) superfamily protein YafD
VDTLLSLILLLPPAAVLATTIGWNPRIRTLFALATSGPLALLLNALAFLCALLLLRGTALAMNLTLLCCITAAQAWFLLPRISRHQHGTDHLTVTACNVLYTNTELEQLSRALLAQNPDVLVLSEVFDEQFVTLKSLLHPLIPVATGGHPGTAVQHRTESTPLLEALDVVVFARPGLATLPAEDLTAGMRRFPCVSLPSHNVVVCGAHTTSPHRPNDPREWRAQLRAIAERASSSSAFVVAGDLNASYRHAPLRNSPLRPSSRSWRPTWPARLSLLELDHVLAANCAVTDAETFHLPGSDHLGVTARIM